LALSLITLAVTLYRYLVSSESKREASSIAEPIATAPSTKSAVENKKDINTPVTEDNIKSIHYLLDAGANWGLAWLMPYALSLNSAKSSLDTIHPLTLTAYTLSTPSERSLLVKAMLRTDSLPGSTFGKKVLERLAEAFKKEHEQDNLLPHLANFATNTNLNVTTLTTLANDKKWEEFVFTILPEARPATATLTPDLSPTPSQIPLAKRVGSIQSSELVANPGVLVDNATISVSWGRQVVVTIEGFTGSVDVNEVARKYLEAIGSLSSTPSKPNPSFAPLQSKLEQLNQKAQSALNETWFYKYVTPWTQSGGEQAAK